VSSRHLVLVGMMGAGKSTVGSRCAKRLGRPFVDTDELIASGAGVSVAELFERDGEPAFRDLERVAVAEACARPTPSVIAVGGGAVLDAGNRKHLRDNGFVVWLHAAPAQLAARVGDGRGRPLLNQQSLHGDATSTLQRLAEERSAAYEAAAHVAVGTDGLDLAAVVDDVLAKFAATAERVP
jgi:shikimate kinase